nr:MAG TPA: hypothetical protein [Caudoviricetes sp.]
MHSQSACCNPLKLLIVKSSALSLKPSFGRTPFLEQKTWP